MFSSHVTTKLGQLIDGRLSPRKSAKVHAHLDQCDSCRKEWEQQAALWAKLGESKPIQPSVAFTERVMRNLDTPAEVGAGTFAESRRSFTPHAEEDADARGGLSAIWRWVGAPAAAVVVGVAVSSAVYFLRPPHHEHDSPKIDQTVAGAIDEKFIETTVRTQLPRDDAENILKTLDSLPPEAREEYLHRVWERYHWNKEDLRRNRKD